MSKTFTLWIPFMLGLTAPSAFSPGWSIGNEIANRYPPGVAGIAGDRAVESAGKPPGRISSPNLTALSLDPILNDGGVDTAILVIEHTGKMVMAGIRVDLTLVTRADSRLLASRILDFAPGLNEVTFRFELIVDPDPAVLEAFIDVDNIVVEWDELNNRITTGLAPREEARLALATNLSTKTRFCAHGRTVWNGRAVYQGLHPETGYVAVLSGGCLYYTLVRLADEIVIDADMVHTDDLGYWRIETILPEEDDTIYELQLQLADASTSETVSFPFTSTVCMAVAEDVNVPDPVAGDQGPMARIPLPHDRQHGFTRFPPASFDAAVEEVECNRDDLFAGETLTLRARIRADRACSGLSVSWYVTGAAGTTALLVPTTRYHQNGDFFACVSFKPHHAGTYEITAGFGLDFQDEDKTNNSSVLVLNVYPSQDH